MIRKLRFKLISAAMISLFIVITIIIGIVNILNYHGIVQDADGILTILQDNNGRFPQQNTQTDITKQSPEATAPVFSAGWPWQWIRFNRECIRRDTGRTSKGK